jgi:hypothetical protein
VRVRGKINDWLEEHIGLRVVRSERRGLPRDVVRDPRQAGYYDPGADRGCAIFAPTESGVGFNAFSLGPTTYHPWVVAIRAAERSDDRSAVYRVLAAYYSTVQPASLRDWLDIPSNSSPRIDSLPRHAWSVLPWSTKDPMKNVQAIEAAQLAENRLYGLDEGMSAGAKAFGPVSDAKLRVEAVRITKLFDSLRSNGLDHQRPDYDLRATFLLSDGSLSWLSMGGMHRVAMAVAVGVKEIPVRVAAVVRREEVDIWPQVVQGLYDREAALMLFDRLIERRAPTCVAPWFEWVDTEGFL